MIRKLIRKYKARGRVKDREIRRLVRKLPILGVQPGTDLEQLYIMVKGHSFLRRYQRLYFRYINGTISRDNLLRYRRMLEAREVLVTDELGNTFHADRKIVSRGITKLRKVVNHDSY